MKIKTDYVLHSMGNEYVVVAVNDRTEELRGMIRLNETGAFLWREMMNDCTEETLVQALTEKYEVSRETASDAVHSFLEQLSAVDVIEK